MANDLENLLIPRHLEKGGTIGIVAPSSGLAGLFPHRTEQGVRMLEEMGFKVVVAPHARECEGWASSTPENRAADLNAMFASKDIDLILCTIGGNHANQIVKLIDFDLVKKNPKIFLGYSDITVLHYALASQAGLRTYYGPCLISEFAEFPKMLPYTRSWFEKVLMDDRPAEKIEAPQEWTNEFLDWFAKKDLERPRAMQPHQGYEWWRQGKAAAPIWGGAIPSINHMAGTKYWVDPAGTIFFIDIPEGGPGQRMAQSDIDAYLADLDNLGVFTSIAGLVIGRPYQYGEEETKILKAMIERYTKGADYPILYNAAIGHTAPIITVPLGARALIDSAANTFAFEQKGVI
jgi:muramoyltetrapeptide carboxypeptidase